MSDETEYSLDKFPDLNERGAYSIYCEDVRHEHTGKSIYIGVYADTLFVEEFPAILPRLSIVTTAWTVRGRPFEKLVFRVLLDDEVITQDEFDTAAANEKLKTLPSYPSARMRVFKIVNLVPFVIEKPGVLRVRVETEMGEFRAGALTLRASPSQEDESETAAQKRR